jgi:hypothetical protein
MARLRAALRGVARVYLVNVEVPRSWESDANAALAKAAHEWPNATLVDGVHPNAGGVSLYGSLIARAVRARRN